MSVNANRDCTILWAIAEVDTDEIAGTYAPAITTTVRGTGSTIISGKSLWDIMAQSGKDDTKDNTTKVSTPKNTLLEPANTWLNERFIKKDYDESKIQMGTLAFKQGAPRPIPVENLKANTNYYIYFVLITTGQGDTGMSPVYSYKYTTSPETKPKINLYNDSAAGNVQFQTQEDVPANLQYRVFRTEDVDNGGSKDLIQYLNDTFTPIVKPAAATTPPSGGGTTTVYGTPTEGFAFDFPDYYKNVTANTTGIKIATILDAMSTQYDAGKAGWTSNSNLPDSTYNGWSIFDIYGSDSDKQNVDGLVRGFRPNSLATASGSVDTKGSVTDWTKEDIWDGNSNMYGYPSTYVLVTVGHNTKSKVTDQALYYTIDSFAAVQGVTKNSLKAPDLTEFKPPKPTLSADGTKVSGALTLIFDYNLYWKSNSGGAGVPVVNTTDPYTPASGSTAASKHVGILGAATMQSATNWGIGVTPGTTTGTSTSPTTVFNIWYKDIAIGSEYIVLPGGLYGNEGGNYYTPEDNMLLRIRFEEASGKNDSGAEIHGAYVVVQWGKKEYRSDNAMTVATATGNRKN